MFNVIFVFCLIGIAMSQQPRPCITPPQWESRLFDSIEQQGVTIQGRISYDSTYHRIRVVENVETSVDDIVLDVIALYDADIQFIYDIIHRNCSRAPLNEPWRDYGISPTATSVGEAYIGSSAFPNGGLLVTIWNTNVTTVLNETVGVLGTWTYQGCLPVSQIATSEKYGREIASFYDVTVGISDPNVFIPRPECLTDEEWANRFTLYGTPNKKNE